MCGSALLQARGMVGSKRPGNRPKRRGLSRFAKANGREAGLRAPGHPGATDSSPARLSPGQNINEPGADGVCVGSRVAGPRSATPRAPAAPPTPAFRPPPGPGPGPWGQTGLCAASVGRCAAGPVIHQAAGSTARSIKPLDQQFDPSSR